jgi:parallel beta-helix repeat protein
MVAPLFLLFLASSPGVERVAQLRPSPGMDKPAMIIDKPGAVVDLARFELRGTPRSVDPDKRVGLGIEVRAKNVTILNAKVRGYMVGLRAVNADGLRIINGDFSDNYKPRLLSTPEREDASDWMSYHKNEKGEWLRYGAGIYLDTCRNFEVRGTKITGGQNGLMMTRTENGKVWNNNFSYLSGIGLGMYRSSKNVIQHNKIDYCVRGFSYGKYNRGQDSAGILVYEQSNENVFAYNSVTHGGDGFFLWAGQTTMDSGKGGCNDNLVYGNDFSHAPTNGIEATFSRNVFANNLVMECWHGVWGGYSYDSKVAGNIFAYNTDGIALEHGQQNSISDNTFYRNETDVRLWQNATQDSNWGYAKVRDTRSRDYDISGNTFSDTVGTVIHARLSKGLRVGRNQYGAVGKLMDLKGAGSDIDFAGATISLKGDYAGTRQIGPFQSFLPRSSSSSSLGGHGKPLPPATALTTTVTDDAEYASRFRTNWNPLAPNPGEVRIGREQSGLTLGAVSPRFLALAPKKLAGGMDPFLKPGTKRGWRTILVDQWGPYGGLRPLLVPARPEQRMPDGAIRYDVLGPAGKWKLVDAKGVSLSTTEGRVPGRVHLKFDDTTVGLTAVSLQYVGGKTVDYRGIESPAGEAISFGVRMSRVPIRWNVTFYPWDKGTQDPRNNELFRQNAPLATAETSDLNYAGFGAFAPKVPSTYFATVATGMVNVPTDVPVEITADDGLRFYIDDLLVIADAWKYQGPTVYRATILKGSHRLRIEHFQIDGYAALQLRVRL